MLIRNRKYKKDRRHNGQNEKGQRDKTLHRKQIIEQYESGLTNVHPSHSRFK